MRYERLRAQVINCSGSHGHEGAAILMRRGMYGWMKTWACLENKRTYCNPDNNTEDILLSDLYNNAVLLMANMVMNNHLQRVSNV